MLFSMKSLISRQLSRKIFDKIESEKGNLENRTVGSITSKYIVIQTMLRKNQETTNKSISLSNLVFNI